MTAEIPNTPDDRRPNREKDEVKYEPIGVITSKEYRKQQYVQRLKKYKRSITSKTT